LVRVAKKPKNLYTVKKSGLLFVWLVTPRPSIPLPSNPDPTNPQNQKAGLSSSVSVAGDYLAEPFFLFFLQLNFSLFG
jgi:hypothetical protein